MKVVFSGSGEQLAEVWLKYGTYNVLLITSEHATQMCNRTEIE